MLETADQSASFAINLGLASDRSPQSPRDVHLPSGMKVVSADNHFEITEDIFYDNFPNAMKDRAPRVWFDRYWHMGFPGGVEAFKPSGRLDDMMERINVRDGFDMAVRKAHMDAEGVSSEIVFPQSLFGLLRLQDLEARELMYRIYNEYVARLMRENPGRFYGVGVFSNWWDPARAEAAMQQIMDLGLKTFMIPTLMKDVDGQEVSLASQRMERFWAVAAEAALPVNFHIGEDAAFGERGMHATYFMTTTSPFRKPLAQIIFGGVLDRHPGLQIVFTEAGINWVASFLQDAELYYGSYGDIAEERPAHNPTHYWRNNCFATFQLDRLGLEMIDYIGRDRVMWGADYPHTEGSFGVGWTVMQDIVDRTSEADARNILGDTARRVYQL